MAARMFMYKWPTEQKAFVLAEHNDSKLHDMGV